MPRVSDLLILTESIKFGSVIVEEQDASGPMPCLSAALEPRVAFVGTHVRFHSPDIIATAGLVL